MLLAVTSVGSLIGSLLTAARPRVGSAWFFGNGAAARRQRVRVAWAPSIWVALLIGIPVGIGGAAFIAGQNAIMQQESPPDMRGRLLALGAVAFLGSTPIGAPITGWVADHVSAEWSLAYGSVIDAGRRVGVGVAAAPPLNQRVMFQPTRTSLTAVQVDDAYGGGVVLRTAPAWAGMPSSRAVRMRLRWPWVNATTARPAAVRSSLATNASQRATTWMEVLAAGAAVVRTGPSRGRARRSRRGEPLVVAVVVLHQRVDDRRPRRPAARSAAVCAARCSGLVKTIGSRARRAVADQRRQAVGLAHALGRSAADRCDRCAAR